MCKGPVAGENLTLEKQSRLVWLQCEVGSLVSSLVPASTGGSAGAAGVLPIRDGLQVVSKAQAGRVSRWRARDTQPAGFPKLVSTTSVAEASFLPR